MCLCARPDGSRCMETFVANERQTERQSSALRQTNHFFPLTLLFSQLCDKVCFLYVIMWPVLLRFGNACVSFSDYFHTSTFPFYLSFAYFVLNLDNNTQIGMFSFLWHGDYCYLRHWLPGGSTVATPTLATRHWLPIRPILATRHWLPRLWLPPTCYPSQIALIQQLTDSI